MRTWTSALAGLALLVMPGEPAHASGIPTVDVAAIAQMVTEYREMLVQSGLMTEELEASLRIIEQNVERARQLQEQIDAMTGSRDLAGLLDGLDYTRVGDILPTDLLGADLSIASEQFTLMLDEDAPWTPEQVRGYAPEGFVARSHRDATDRVFMSMSSADALVGEMDRIDGLYGTLIAAVDDTPDVKASLDLVARISAENGRAINRLTHMMALMAASQAAVERRDIARDEERRTFDPAVLSSVAERMTQEE